MNRTLVIGGLAALAVLLGLASWLLMGGHKASTPTTEEAQVPEGPMALNPVSVITKTGTKEGEDNRTLNIVFSDFELRGSGHEVKTAVFSTTWHVKLQPGERVAVATVDVKGFMSASGAQPQPAPVVSTTTPPPTTTDGTTPPPATAPTPAAPPPPPKPVGGEGVATVFVAVGGTTSSSQWKDSNGEGSDRIQTQAAVFADPAHELRNGGEIPVTVTVELNANGSTEAVAKISSLDLRLFVDNVPEPAAATTTTEEPGSTTTPPATTPPTPAPTNP
jgi:hypothetical protein